MTGDDFQLFFQICKNFITNVSHQIYNVSVKVEKNFWGVEGHATMLGVHHFMMYQKNFSGGSKKDAKVHYIVDDEL